MNTRFLMRRDSIPEIETLIARVIKAADIQDNLSDSKESSRADKYRFALDVIDPHKEMRRYNK